MANQAVINATSDQKALRNVERYKRLVNDVIPRRQAKGLPVDTHREEAERRLADINALKKALAEVDV